ncbi:MAG: cation:proton antiporter [Planctomycetes bacterium]|nr:cation:proton antiporter [Planctomycetota bacterium]
MFDLLPLAAVPDMPLVTTIAAGLGVALVLGYITQRLKLSPIIGYLLAGVVVGPYTPGFVADPDIAFELAEIGVALLMFGVGLHFRLKDLLAVRSVALPGAIVQSAVATGLGVAMALISGWGLASGLVLGLGLSVASTVVLIRGLEDSNQFSTPAGHIAVGWLIVEDILTVLVLVMLPALTIAMKGGQNGDGGASTAWPVITSLGQALGMVALLAGLMLLAGARIVPWMLAKVARTRSRELFTLCVLALAIGIAVVSAKAFGASVALGAFLAGMVVGQSRVSHQAAADALPMRDAFAVLFFVSVGMLFEPRFLLEEPWLVASALGVILIGKPLAAMFIVLVLGRSIHMGLVAAVSLAQIGEFSFILATAAIALNTTLGQQVFDPQVMSVLVASSLISITINPLLFRTIPAIEGWIRRRPRLQAFLQRQSENRAKAVNSMTRLKAAKEEGASDKIKSVVVGYGPVGQTVARILREFEIEPVVVEMNVDTVLRLNEEGHSAIYGDAAREDILIAAGIKNARYLLVTLPDAASRIPVIITAKEINPDLRVLTRARFVREAPMLEEIGANMVSFEEVEGAVALASLLLREVGAEPGRIDTEGDRIRRGLFRPSMPEIRAATAPDSSIEGDADQPSDDRVATSI